MNSLLIAFYLLSQSSGANKEVTKPQEQYKIGEEVITGEAEMKITDQKPYLLPQIDAWSPVKEMVEINTYIFDPELFRTMDSLTIPRYFIHSSFLRVPVERSYVYGDILIFLPSFEQRVASWELVIANSLGETVRRLRQKGHPPAVITWDGKDDQGNPIATGDVYSFTFNAYDAQGNQTRIPCEPQRINAILWKQGEEWILSVAAEHIFLPEGAQLVEPANSRLDEIGNVLKEKFKKEIVVYVYTEKEELSLDRCRVIEGEIKKRMVLPQEALKVVPRFIPGLQPKYSKIEIHIQ